MPVQVGATDEPGECCSAGRDGCALPPPGTGPHGGARCTRGGQRPPVRAGALRCRPGALPARATVARRRTPSSAASYYERDDAPRGSVV